MTIRLVMLCGFFVMARCFVVMLGCLLRHWYPPADWLQELIVEAATSFAPGALPL
jgi:hypothetical protein